MTMRELHEKVLKLFDSPVYAKETEEEIIFTIAKQNEFVTFIHMKESNCFWGHCEDKYTKKLTSELPEWAKEKQAKLSELIKEYLNLNKIEPVEEAQDNNVKPNHYKLNIRGQVVEVMDIIDAVVKDMDGRKGYIVGNILKYVCRAEKKNGLEDYKKARTYLDMLIDAEIRDRFWSDKDDARQMQDL